MFSRDLANEATYGGLKTAAGAGVSALNAASGQALMSLLVGLATFIFLVAQVIYLYWKWRRNSKLQGMVP